MSDFEHFKTSKISRLIPSVEASETGAFDDPETEGPSLAPVAGGDALAGDPPTI
jgi:hypothetical protein